MDPRILEAFTLNHGALYVHDYMSLCNQVYYTTCQPLGPKGDFITAPEVSPLFGEIIGLTLLDGWYRLGKPSAFDLIELGPGRGYLMQDILRITKNHPSFHQALSLSFVEINPGFEFSYPHKRYADIEQALQQKPAFIVANEFFDALPVHQFYDKGLEKKERYVYLEKGALRFSEGDASRIQEISTQGENIFLRLSHHIKRYGGAALILDYGYAQKDAYGDTLQAVKKHKYAKVLENPGTQDLTVHVNFQPFIDMSIDREVPYSYETQRHFLLHKGLWQRAYQVMSSGQLQDPQRYLSAIQRLIDPHAMGTLFKTFWMEKTC